MFIKKRTILSKQPQKIVHREKKLRMSLLVGQCLQNIHLIKQVYRVIQFNQKAWLKTYINMNNKYRKEEKNDFEKDFLKLMNNCVCGKTLQNVRNHRDIKLVTSDKRRKRLVSGPNYHLHKNF